EGIDYIDIYKDRLVLITSSEKKFNHNPLTTKDLIGEEIVLREEGSGTRLLIENALKEKGLGLNIFKTQTISYSLGAIKKMVALNIGISFSSEISVKNEVNSGYLNQYKVEDLNLNRNFSFAYCNNRCLSPLEEKFKEFVTSWKWDNIDI
ncbi:MAG TPA: LysR substrate-binding domain-containing protein, partial [Atribacterota bacterium]|nr:LysR substrate-binding domain-containing protein [Atribacterota bacterium]